VTRHACPAVLLAGCLSTPGMADPDARVVDAAHDAMVDAPIQSCVTGFDGTHANTEIESGRLVMSDTGMLADWTSPIVDSGEAHAWVLSWTPAIPSLKRLPPDAGVETGYLGGVDMTGNVLLYQFDETAGGLFADTSGNDLEGACSSCPTLGASAVFNTGASFTANNSVYRVDDARLEPAMVSIEAWSRKTGTHGTGGVGSAGSIIAKGSHSSSEPYSSWSIEQVENVSGQQPRAMRCYMGHTTGGATALGTMGIAMDANFHTVCTYDGSAIRLYVNGTLADTESMPQGIDYTLAGGQSTDLTIGTWGMVNQDFTGVVDVIAIYDRVLDEDEIARRWLRGALRVFIQVKVCDDDACDGEDWVGPSGDATTSYTEYCNDGLGPPRDLPTNDLDCDRDGVDDDGITGSAVAPGRWAQMKIHLESADPVLGPEVLDASFCAVDP
jgi:hypothetical protein